MTKNVFVHVSYLQTQQFGRVPCNGMIYVSGDEVVVFDTPGNNADSEALINWVEKTWKKKITAVVVNHFHNDCLGGLEAFHTRGIPSYANALTLELARADSVTVPQNGFTGQKTLKFGQGGVVENRFFGEAHTRDNIVSYLPREKVLFGGCMIKAMNAEKGYLADANTTDWSATVEKIKQAYPDLKFVIPGHGEAGGIELLEFTAGLFKDGK